MSDHAERPYSPTGSANADAAREANAGHTAGHEEVAPAPVDSPAEPQFENLPIRKVITVGVVSLIIFAVGGAWAMKMRSSTIDAMNPTGAPALPASLGAEEQGMVDQIPFDLNHWVKDDREASAKQLNNYGWVDRKAGTVHIPIERAIELQLAEHKK